MDKTPGINLRTTKEDRDDWENMRGRGMISAVGEYTPSEFWDLLDDVNDLEQELATERKRADEAAANYATLCATHNRLIEAMQGEQESQKLLLQEANRRADEAERDAKRYRWLRDKSVPPHNFYISVPVEFHEVRYVPSEVDAYIDEAMRNG